MPRLAALGAVAALAACSQDAPARATPPPDVTVTPVGPDHAEAGDAGTDELAATRVDEDVNPARRYDRGPHTRRTLEIMLRSSPSGADAAVDGELVGKTPVLWEGEFTGREREFTFALSGYVIARYRFAPTTNGVVHGKLDKLVGDSDAGVPVAGTLPLAPAAVVPPPARQPAPAAVPPAPPTVVAAPDAGVPIAPAPAAPAPPAPAPARTPPAAPAPTAPAPTAPGPAAPAVLDAGV